MKRRKVLAFRKTYCQRINEARKNKAYKTTKIAYQLLTSITFAYLFGDIDKVNKLIQEEIIMNTLAAEVIGKELGDMAKLVIFLSNPWSYLGRRGAGYVGSYLGPVIIDIYKYFRGLKEEDVNPYSRQIVQALAESSFGTVGSIVGSNLEDVLNECIKKKYGNTPFGYLSDSFHSLGNYVNGHLKYGYNLLPEWPNFSLIPVVECKRRGRRKHKKSKVQWQVHEKMEKSNNKYSSSSNNVKAPTCLSVESPNTCKENEVDKVRIEKVPPEKCEGLIPFRLNMTNSKEYKVRVLITFCENKIKGSSENFNDIYKKANDLLEIYLKDYFFSGEKRLDRYRFFQKYKEQINELSKFTQRVNKKD